MRYIFEEEYVLGSDMLAREGCLTYRRTALKDEIYSEKELVAGKVITVRWEGRRVLLWVYAFLAEEFSPGWGYTQERVVITPSTCLKNVQIMKCMAFKNKNIAKNIPKIETFSAIDVIFVTTCTVIKAYRLMKYVYLM